ncbi:hypothetical protein MMSP_3517 [Mycobacterium sp. 012931]|nr:hypothetical protein MMSP_3517 [Mycobacterium sp. 012931]
MHTRRCRRLRNCPGIRGSTGTVACDQLGGCVVDQFGGDGAAVSDNPILTSHLSGPSFLSNRRFFGLFSS